MISGVFMAGGRFGSDDMPDCGIHLFVCADYQYSAEHYGRRERCLLANSHSSVAGRLSADWGLFRQSGAWWQTAGGKRPFGRQSCLKNKPEWWLQTAGMLNGTHGRA